jgi:large subunit ribosomal protein L3
MPFILGKKFKMSQIWQEEKVIPVTLIKVAPNKVALVRTNKKDGYEAIQIFDGKNKREFKGSEAKELKAGDQIDLSGFKEGGLVKITGLTKGRGFQGVVKRHGFSGGPKTHGQKNRYRAPGSIGSTAFQRVVPGRRMAGRMGQEKVTVKNLKIAAIDKENNILMVKGAVPGSIGTLLAIRTD